MPGAASRADAIDVLHGCAREAIGAAGDGFDESLRCQNDQARSSTKTGSWSMGSREQEPPCPPLGQDLGDGAGSAKAAIPPNRAAIARRAEPRESWPSDPPAGPDASVAPPAPPQRQTPKVALTTESRAAAAAPHRGRPATRPMEHGSTSRRLRRRNDTKTEPVNAAIIG